ncbi:extensin family protein [Aurantiacibacter sp. MUD61]|uniref:extensin family protein n=1 Tax=Aurantiacibacter sp. MUD61 TaxID=3009083 RepID=UPI0022F10F82|nr:extensin family protein [Aurantiacibacter sp. MUD61]
MSDTRIGQFDGKPLVYDRSAPSHYGVGGVPTKPYINAEFAKQCEKCFAELFSFMDKHAGLVVESILTGGVSRAGMGTSLHHKNRAFDLDAFLFADGSNWVATTFPQRPQLYLGIEAILRRHFGTVLSYDYNAAHRDHFHFDNGTNVGFKQSAKSHVIFIQNVLTFVYQIPAGRDGVWGPETEREVTALRKQLEIGPFSTKSNWLEFLSTAAKAAFELEAGKVGDLEPLEPLVCECCGRPF